MTFRTRLIMKSLLNDVDPDKVNYIPVGQYTHDYEISDIEG
jgi:hypothetical protein